MANTKYSPVVQELADLIKSNNWTDIFNQGIAKMDSYNIPGLSCMKSIEDYLDYLQSYCEWVPAENREGTNVYSHLFNSFFVLDQEPIKSLQTPCKPAYPQPKLSPLSQWMVDYSKAIGDWLDTPESITADSVKSFYECAVYNMDEYEEPRGGWKTFNQMFARHVKPGWRPIAAPTDDKIIVHPADACFGGQWEIRPDTHVKIKGLDWSIDELLEGSPYKDKFKGGMWCHSFLSWTDYHRQHAPLAGIVREARVIQGANYVDLVAVPSKVDPATQQVEAWRATAPDAAGYEFMQTRGLIVLETKYGYVAILPIAMPQVASVVVTCEEGRALAKGDEISYFQFGGSDIVYLFSANMNVSISAHKGTHYKVGTKIGEIYPVVEL